MISLQRQKSHAKTQSIAESISIGILGLDLYLNDDLVTVHSMIQQLRRPAHRRTVRFSRADQLLQLLVKHIYQRRIFSEYSG